MAAGYQNLLIEQGTSFATNITLDDVTGATYNLSNFVAFSQIKNSYYTSNVSGNFLVTITNPNSGVITVSMNAANTANLFPGRYVYDVVLQSLTDPADFTIRILEGIVEVSPGVTNINIY